MQKFFNKTFFHLLFGFVGIIAASLSVLFSIGFYQSEVLGIKSAVTASAGNSNVGDQAVAGR